MPTPKYIFTSANNQLVLQLDNSTSQWDDSITSNYRNASVNLYNKKIQLYDYGLFEMDFLLENIKTIGGVSPTDISNAYTLLTALIPA